MLRYVGNLTKTKMLQTLIIKSPLIIIPLIFFNLFTHDARLEHIMAITNAPANAYTEEVFKVESVILADSNLPSYHEHTDKSLTCLRETANRVRRQDKEVDNIIRDGVSYDLYANA